MRDFSLGEVWEHRVFPRRGTRGARPFAPSPNAGPAVADQLRVRPERIIGALDRSAEPELRDAGHAWLDDANDVPPVGAAAVALAALEHRWGLAAHEVPFADLWIAERGIPFAAQAAVRIMTLTVDDHPFRQVRSLRENERRPLWTHNAALVTTLRVRTALATAPDATYEQVVRELAAHRHGHPYRRLATSLLAPTETAWVDEGITAALTSPDSGQALALTLSARTAEQLRGLGEIGPAAAHLPSTPWALATVVDGVGAQSRDVLLSWLDPDHPEISRRTLLDIVSRIPQRNGPH